MTIVDGFSARLVRTIDRSMGPEAAVILGDTFWSGLGRQTMTIPTAMSKRVRTMAIPSVVS